MRISVDFSKDIGSVKPMHGVGQPPYAGTFGGYDYRMMHCLKDAGIPFSRLHDTGGLYGEYQMVDIPNIFRDFDADPENPDSYDFSFTDNLMAEIVKQGTEPFYRLGVTIENQAAIHALRIFPPKDYQKWAVICEHIVRHYNEGWANGYHYHIRYWEIWNEPDGECNPSQMWMGTREEYFRLYTVTAKYLKKLHPDIKVGGYGGCGFYGVCSADPTKMPPLHKVFMDFFEEFLTYVKKEGAPLDFYSWHTYSDIAPLKKMATYARERLDYYGYTDTETICDEWNAHFEKRGQPQHASWVIGMMIEMQHSPLDSAMFYDARWCSSDYAGLFDPYSTTPLPAYDAFLMYNELYRRGREVAVDGCLQDVYASAAKDDHDGVLVVSNTSLNIHPIQIVSDRRVAECWLLDGGHMKKQSVMPRVLRGESVLMVRFE